MSLCIRINVTQSAAIQYLVKLLLISSLIQQQLESMRRKQIQSKYINAVFWKNSSAYSGLEI